MYSNDYYYHPFLQIFLEQDLAPLGLFVTWGECLITFPCIVCVKITPQSFAQKTHFALLIKKERQRKGPPEVCHCANL